MSIFAIGDLHLPGGDKKPMDVFGAHWERHFERICADWQSRVKPEDIVLIPGDISWAMQLGDALNDLREIAKLPGTILLLRGNHDYWWSSLSKMQQRYGAHFEFLQNDCIMVEDIAVCGTRGWLLPSAESFSDADRKIYNREGIRLELSLQQAHKIQAQQIITAFHYPPLFARTEHTCFTNLMLQYGVQHCVYGHIHGENHIPVFEGLREGINYKLVSCDTQAFQLYKVI